MEAKHGVLCSACRRAKGTYKLAKAQRGVRGEFEPKPYRKILNAECILLFLMPKHKDRLVSIPKSDLDSLDCFAVVII